MDNRYIKHFLPLESNPAVFNELIHLLGAEDVIAFEDVLTLDDPELVPDPPLPWSLSFPPPWSTRRGKPRPKLFAESPPGKTVSL
jgi:hypothetical protein